MKKLIYLILFTISLSASAQVKVVGSIEPNNSADTYPTHQDIYGKGGFMTVATTTARDAITSDRRKELMLVGVIADQKIYQLKGGITNADWVEFSSGLSVESDPIFGAHVASGITGTNITNWNTAYSWGNHASAGYLTSSTAASTYEPIFSKNTAFNKNFGTTAGTVTEGNDSRVLNGQTAYGWGNHAGLYPLYNGTGATGTWGIDISGNASTATTATNWSGSSTLGSAAYTSSSAYEVPLIFNGPIVRSINSISIPPATGSVNGYLSSTDWTTFNNKLSTSTAASTYLPLIGGTLTGGLSGTTGTFSGNLRAVKLGIGKAPSTDLDIDVTSGSNYAASIWNRSSTGLGLTLAGGNSSNAALGITDYNNGSYKYVIYGDGRLLSQSSANFAGTGEFGGALTIPQANVANTVIVGATSAGNIRLNSGSSTQAGFMEFYKGNGSTRLGYIGYDNTNINYIAENGAIHNFSGTIAGSTINGTTINASTGFVGNLTGNASTVSTVSYVDVNSTPTYVGGWYGGILKATSPGNLANFLSGQSIGNVNTSTSYLPISGGTISGGSTNPLNITTSTSGGYVEFRAAGTPIGYFGSADQLFTGGTNSNFALTGASGKGLQFGTANTLRYSISSGGDHDFKTGTATFGNQINLQNASEFRLYNSPNNNWSYIKNTASGSQSNLEFASGVGTMANFNHDGSATFKYDLNINKSGSTASTMNLGSSAVDSYGRFNYLGNSTNDAHTLGYHVFYNSQSGTAIPSAIWEVMKDGTASDNKARMTFGLNNGSGVATALTLSSTLDATFTGSLNLGGVGKRLYMTNASGTVNALTPSNFGYSSTYKILQLGDASANQSLAFNVDISGNPSGAFNGGGQEYIWRKAGSFITPNTANNGYNTLMTWDDGSPTFPNGVTSTNGNFTGTGTFGGQIKATTTGEQIRLHYDASKFTTLTTQSDGSSFMYSWTGSVYKPIYINYDNANATGQSTYFGGNIYTSANYGFGLVGTYTSDRYQGVFAMGDAYKLPADGTTPGNLYGITWTHSNVGGQGTRISGHQADFMEAGTTMTAIGNGIWTNGGITATGTITAPTFSGDLSGTISSGTTASTQATNTNNTTVATTAFVNNQIIGTVGYAPRTVATVTDFKQTIGSNLSTSFYDHYPASGILSKAGDKLVYIIQGHTNNLAGVSGANQYITFSMDGNSITSKAFTGNNSGAFELRVEVIRRNSDMYTMQFVCLPENAGITVKGSSSEISGASSIYHAYVTAQSDNSPGVIARGMQVVYYPAP